MKLRRKLEERSKSSSSKTSKSPRPTLPKHIEKLVDKMVKVLPLFDKILKEEFVDAAGVGNLKRSDNGRKQVQGSEGFYGLTCDYCGADIFQSYFECSTCGDSNSTDRETRDPIHICVGCAVEGRSCNCGQARPRQRCESDVLFKIQNAAVEAVKPFVSGQVKPAKLGLKFVFCPPFSNLC